MGLIGMLTRLAARSVVGESWNQFVRNALQAGIQARESGDPIGAIRHFEGALFILTRKINEKDMSEIGLAQENLRNCAKEYSQLCIAYNMRDKMTHIRTSIISMRDYWTNHIYEDWEFEMLLEALDG